MSGSMLFMPVIVYVSTINAGDTDQGVIDSLCNGGLVDDALNLHSEVMEKRILPDVWTYSPIIQVLCSLKRWEEVGLLLNQMIYDMKISPDVHSFSILVDAYSDDE
ncbi:hypothetical protein POM88_024020 [Heracleum sosnowskyi]|uniref:Pentatricopeptide repeat-containing protein n=1 Tax=Heracleum sosnowskyi TaxID=360622 RepID=A0AAD8IID0_9APIA|nr:hypothetical protein POM88_024020 [Heracleum sosnowskyi]